jgi:hypothetical protein
MAKDNEDERHLILEMIESGKITASDGLRLLQVLAESDVPDPGGEEETSTNGHLPAASLPETRGAAVFPPTTEPARQPDNDERAGGQPIALSTTPDPPADGAKAQAAEESDPRFHQATGTNPASTFLVAEPEEDGERESQARRDYSRFEQEKWRNWWKLPLWAGVGVTILGGLLMFWVQQASGVGFWFFCASLPFWLGLALIVLAWQSRTARWLHIRVYENIVDEQTGVRPRKIAISLPVPTGIIDWFLRTFREWIPGLQGSSVDEIVLPLRNSTTPDQPLFIEVDEGVNGERVEIYFG